MNLTAIIGANYGDEGKGLATAFLSSGLKRPLFVLTNGGAQRGHTMESMFGLRHVFHHFASTTIERQHVWFPMQFCVNPIIFSSELTELHSLHLYPRVYCHQEAPVTTPYDMIVNQVMELDRGDNRHGSTGMGVFVTTQRHKEVPLTFKDVKEGKTKEKIKSIKEWCWKALENCSITLDYVLLFRRESLLDRWLEDVELMRSSCTMADEGLLRSYDDVVFENAQGLLLSSDPDNPHTTPSRTGADNIVDIVKAADVSIDRAEVCYVTRSYMTRHGAGPFPTECPKEMINPSMVDLTNQPNQWQGTLRYGTLDLEKLNDRTNEDFSRICFPAIKSVMLTHANECRVDTTRIRDLRYVSSDKRFSMTEKI